MAPLLPAYFERTLRRAITRATPQFPVLTLTGPRQSGKTTLLRYLLGSDYRYVSVDRPSILDSIRRDPYGFLAAYPPPVILDEAQTAPELFPYIKEAVDLNHGQPAQFILSGSHNLQLLQNASESLAGRTAILNLYPFTLREVVGEPFRPLPWERPEGQPVSSSPLDWSDLLRRFYPSLTRHPEIDSTLWYSSYVQTFLERDVRLVRQVGDYAQFHLFLRALALRSAQLFSYSELSRDLGVAVNTIKAWLSVLIACHLIFILPPYFDNTGKRLVKTPKIYFLDTGLYCHLCGLESANVLALGPFAGPLMETLVVSEIYKTLAHRGQSRRLYFWRTSTGREVDLIVEDNTRLIPIEIKASATPWPSMADSIAVFRRDYPQATKGWVVYSGAHPQPLSQHATAWPVNAL